MKRTHICFLIVLLIFVLCAFTIASPQSLSTPGVFDFSYKYAAWAFLLGALSAVSLPLGSIIGVIWQPKSWVTAALAAFGAGALLAALTVELVAPTMLNVTMFEETSTGARQVEPITLIIGCFCGGILFVVLDQLLNARGGYLRKTATTINYMSRRKSERTRRILQGLGKSDFFRAIPVTDIQNLVNLIRPVEFNKGDVIFREGDKGDRMYFIEEGEVNLIHLKEGLKKLASGDVLGEIAVVTGAPRTADATALTDVKAMELTRTDFLKMSKISPEFDTATVDLASKRLAELSKHDASGIKSSSEWAAETAQALRQGLEIPTTKEIRLAAKGHTGAPLAIWLGIFLDGIPESFVIGISFLTILMTKMVHGTPAFGELIPYTLIAGLFLSNFPEAMSSSIGMRKLDWGITRVLMLWMSLMVMTAAGAAIGYAVGADVSPIFIVFMDGLAAGAMLTMIAQTMIPEAVHLGGNIIVGLSTLIGFLSAVAFKILEV